MRKGLSRDCGISLSVVLSLAITGLIAITPRLHAASNEHMITSLGQTIPSIFDGLVPSQFRPNSVLKRSRSRNSLWKENLSDAHLGARYLKACTLCSPGGCFGSFERATPCSGCCTDSTGCPGINNYTTDSKNYDQDDHVKDEPCGVDCCDDFANCPD
jgi:hypothetical protein